MRHRNHSSKLNRTSSHRRCMMANMLKALIVNGRIETTIAKAKNLRRYADRMITLAKGNTLATRRRAIAELMIRFNALTPKQQRATRKDDFAAYNDDRIVIGQLFDVLGPRFKTREGGYTRIVKHRHRIGDSAPLCVIEYLAD